LLELADPQAEVAPVLTIGALVVPLAEVYAQATIRHGRAEPDDQPTSSTIQLALTGWASDQVRAGQELAFDYAGVPRFRGQVSDVAIRFPAGLAALELTGAGNLARIARRKIGYGDWPAEPWSDRAARIMAEAGWSAYLIDPPPPSDQVVMAARLASETTVNAMLTDLAVTGAAAITDLPDGVILLQPLSARHAASDAFQLPADEVAFAPAWRQALDVVNLAVVAYGPIEDSHTVSTRNASSVNTYGERSSELATTFAAIEDASARGLQLVTRLAVPRWLVDSVILFGLPAGELRPGRRAILSSLPLGSPVGSSFAAALEGWTESLEGDDWTTTLSLSDPARSGLTITWDTAPADLAWREVDPACQWQTAYSADDLEG
jgi:hypothetical protein